MWINAGADGFVVMKVNDGGAAARAGLQKDDVIVAIDGQKADPGSSPRRVLCCACVPQARRWPSTSGAATRTRRLRLPCAIRYDGRMNLDRYLKRIGLDHRPPATLAGLKTVHRAHLLAIPYENIDVQLGRPVTTAVGPIYEKMVERGRGGWCYEMNGMLGWALAELGFDVTRATGAVVRAIKGEAAVGNHLVLRVALPEGLYLADVGFGDGPRDPIPVAVGAFESEGFHFGLSRIDDAWWRFANDPRRRRAELRLQPGAGR